MPPKLALLIGFVFVGLVFRVVERKRQAPVSAALFWPLLWYVVGATRPVGVWLSIWGVPLPGGSGDVTDGSVVDRSFYLTLSIIGIWILARRQILWRTIFRENAWLVALFAFMLLSAVWSDFHWVSFKRFIKSFSAVVMVLVVLTEPDSVAAIRAILRRCAYLFVPLSIIVIRYFRDIGVSFDWFGQNESWQGLATSKNTLGQIAMVSALCFVWEILRNREEKHAWSAVDYLYLAMSLYLLKGSDEAVSMTSVSVFAFGLLIFTRLRFLRHKLFKVPWFLAMLCLLIFGTLSLLIVHTLRPFPQDSFLGVVIRTLGRDMTLSGRTNIWSEMLTIASKNPLLGVGFGGFWIGRLANIPWSTTMTWALGQGHNGYLDTYLQIGWIGIFLLTAVILTACPKIIRSFAVNFEYGCFRMTFFVVILFVNIMETTFLRGDHALWFLFLLAALSVPAAQTAEPALASSHATEEEKEVGSAA
jgi:O-antigen ligase